MLLGEVWRTEKSRPVLLALVPGSKLLGGSYVFSRESDCSSRTSGFKSQECVLRRNHKVWIFEAARLVNNGYAAAVLPRVGFEWCSKGLAPSALQRWCRACSATSLSQTSPRRPQDRIFSYLCLSASKRGDFIGRHRNHSINLFCCRKPRFPPIFSTI